MKECTVYFELTGEKAKLENEMEVMMSELVGTWLFGAGQLDFARFHWWQASWLHRGLQRRREALQVRICAKNNHHTGK